MPELVERSDLPEGQQSKGSSCDALCRDIEEDRDRLAAELARVRAEVAEEIAQDLAEWARRQFAQATVAWNPQSKRDLEAYGRAYDNGAGVARLHAGKAPESPAGRLDRVWWYHDACDSGFVPAAAGEPRPATCPGCGSGEGSWSRLERVGPPVSLPKE